MLGEILMRYKEWESSVYLHKEWRDENNYLHREDGPASICHHKNGLLHSEKFYFHSRIHRELGPANIVYYPNGLIERIQYWFFGHLNRVDGPAAVYYNSDGSIKYEEFWMHGALLGLDKEGFWMLWSSLTEDERKSTNILKCLARYS
jgi:hypothetical protein